MDSSIFSTDRADGSPAERTAPPGASFVRRWSIEPADANGDLLVVQVLVRPVSAGSAAGPRRLNGEARFVSVRARVLR